MKQVKCKRCGKLMPNLGGCRKWCTNCKPTIDAERNMEHSKAIRKSDRSYYYSGYAFMILDNSMKHETPDLMRIARRLDYLGVPYNK